MMLETDVVVVGAGPAGLSAALEASLGGAKVIVVDEYARPGGQYFKQPAPAFKLLDKSAMGRDYQVGLELMSRIEQGKVELFADTLVWGAFRPDVLETYREGRCQQIGAGRVVIATGAYDRPIAFPGWTLPGVITAGAAQTLMKNQWVVPGKRILMAGAGPFQLPAAAHLVNAEATVVALLEASRINPGWLAQGMLNSWRHPAKVREAWDYIGPLIKAGIDMRSGWTVLEARGRDQVEEAVIARLDDEWRPVPGTEKVLEVDTVCIGFGFLPSLQLPRLLGCRSIWNGDLTTWVTECDSDQRSSVPEVFVAGETTGIGGHEVAICEGAIAGIRAAEDLGKLSADEAGKRLVKVAAELKHHRVFVDYLSRTFSIKPGIYDLIRDDTVICRCEEATAGEIAQVAKEWNGSLRTIKQLTRAGMGNCQGRICGALVAQIAAKASGKTVKEIGIDTPRPPIKPIPLEALAVAPE